MKRTRHTAEQIIRKLKTAEQLIAQGKTVADVCRVIEVTQPTYRLLRREGWSVNHKRVQRLWREEGLQLQEAQAGQASRRVRAASPG
jgi:transposase InsO family protein